MGARGSARPRLGEATEKGQFYMTHLTSVDTLLTEGK